MKIPAGRRRFVWDKNTQSCVEQHEIQLEKALQLPISDTTLRPKKTIQKILISTTSKLVGEYEGHGILLMLAWPNFYDRVAFTRHSPGPGSRNAFVFAFETPPLKEATARLPDYSPEGETMCSYLALLFGKRFDNHGFIEEMGHFHVPELSAYGYLCDPGLPQNTHESRINFSVPLNLAELSRIEPLLTGTTLDPKFLRTFQGAAKFYLQAMHNAEHEPEVAYLHLITAGEILSGYYDYVKEDLMDDNIKEILRKVRTEVTNGTKIANQIAERLFQVKRKFLESIVQLIDSQFLDSPARPTIGGFRADSFRASISAAYDLRSRYVHTGIPFGKWVSLRAGGNNNEVPIGSPMVDDKEFRKILTKAPTYIGLERVIRYCLLQFAKNQGAYVEAR